MFKRIGKLPDNHSFFLFGARGTGKSTLLETIFNAEETLWIDLLDDEVLDRYSMRPNTLVEELGALNEDKRPKWIVIDEVQKCPKLLNVVHRLIEAKENNYLFALTGSSARKLKQKGANLLAGRAWMENLYPMTYFELEEEFVLDEILNWGALPRIFSYDSEEDKSKYLRSYALTYIKSEVQEEQWVRKLEPFRKFLPIATQMNGRPLNYSNIAKDVGVTSVTVQSYYEILEDTLLGFMLPSFHTSIRKQQRLAQKFYFFDLGVKRAFENRLNIKVYPETSEYGQAFEHFVICEMHRLNSYYQKDFTFSYLLTKDDLEIDLIVDRPGENQVFIEIKSKTKVDERDIRHLESIQTDIPDAEYIVLSRDPLPKKIKNCLALPWQEGIKRIFNL